MTPGDDLSIRSPKGVIGRKFLDNNTNDMLHVQHDWLKKQGGVKTNVVQKSLVKSLEFLHHPGISVPSVELRRQVYPHCSCKEGFADLVTLQDVPKVSWSRTFSTPHRLARGADELEAS